MANAARSWGRGVAWVALSVASAAACGGRGNLAVGELDEEVGGSSFGSTGGNAAAGTPVQAGSSVGGSASGSGFGGAGSAGAPLTAGTGSGGVPQCSPQVPCLPDSVCKEGKCVSVQVCVPGIALCQQNTLRICNAQGTGTFVRQVCAGDQFCDVATAKCEPGVCAPNRPVCIDEVAATCNGNGSDYQAIDDCERGPNRHCEQGVCVCDGWTADCDDAIGCETNLYDDPNNCRGCGISCSSQNMATRSCSGRCDGTCRAGYDDCNSDKQADGCETRIDTDVDNCGGCELACSTNHIQRSCNGGTCDGACHDNFADCNGDKLSDGCESDSRSDVNNCGGCGLRCSSNHISRACSAGKCSGACTTGFQDCNGDKLRDGCEVDTRSDSQHCGACNKPCPAGKSCLNGTCGELLTFSGVQQNVPTSSLLGWTECFSGRYGEDVPLSAVLQKCSGGQLLLACRQSGATSLRLAAHAPRADVLFATSGEQETHEANGVGWYHSAALAWGFAPAGEGVQLNSCDVVDSGLSPSGTGGDRRLCWHLSSGSLRGGWRCGREEDLNESGAFERVIFHAP